MNKQFLLGLAIAASVSVLGMPTIARSQMRIGDLQQRPPGTTISGRVTSVVGNDFILEDESGQIIVDAGPRWWQQINISPGEQVTVNGELGRGGEFDAFSITRANGTVIQIRPAQGPPPWAGGSNRAPGARGSGNAPARNSLVK
ncbi:DNA-binding protein [Chroogloeocystis siderophila]|uniref:DNA-binding protein n=1 Tax=Chroogloeocystis siderophila 5.2 s.c.1 TaxID=247279 RepID=A0A1U7HM23_9CHRO|nr:DNA-binding protein [Chroogloeocystis siderophila]OKH24636.1 DNA-binding protein [Chroogloeocystis siderophila 5.2 s.c.1]